MSATIPCHDQKHQNEFVEKLSAILAKPNSSIAVAFMAHFENGDAALFFGTDSQLRKGIDIQSVNSVFMFDFVTPFGRDKKTQLLMGDTGIYAEDAFDLAALFDEYTFKNPAEGRFFASKFFYNAKGKIPESIVYFKFKVSEDLNTCVIDGKYLQKSYGFIDQEQLSHHVVKSDSSKKLYELSLLHVVRHNDKNHVLEKVKAGVLSYMSYEVYWEMSTNKFYVGNIFRAVNGEIVEEPVAVLL